MRSFVTSLLIGVLVVAGMSISVVRAEPVADWEQLGERFEISVNASAYTYEGAVYVAYRNEQAQIAVKTFNAASGEWEAVGQNGGHISVYNGYNPRMYVDQGEPYVIFSDQQSGNRVLVKRYNETTDQWETVGSAGFSDDRAANMSLVASGSDTLYAAYMEQVGADRYLPMVMKYEEGTGDWEEAGGASVIRDYVASESRELGDIVLQADGHFVYLAYVEMDGRPSNRTVKVWRFDESNPGAGWAELRGDSGTLPKIRNMHHLSMVVYKNIPYVTYENQLADVVIMKFQDGEWSNAADPIEDVFRPRLVVENGVPYLSYFESDIYYEDDGANHRLLVQKFDGEHWMQVGSAILPTRAGETLTNYGLQFDHGDLYVLYAEFWEPDWTFYANVKKIREASLYLPSPILSAAGPKAAGSTAVITFADDPAWRSAIGSVRIDGEALTPDVDYTIAPGRLTIIRPELLPPGKHAITVRAEGYALTSAVQSIRPDAPGDVQIKAAGNRFVDLSWPAVDGAEAYTIYYGTDADVTASYIGQLTVSATQTHYLITKLTNDELYYFAVAASADNVESEPSGTVSARPTYAPGPDEWAPLGNRFAGFQPQLVADGNDLYVAYRNSPGGDAGVRKYVEGTGWTVIGEGKIAELNAYAPSLAVDEGTPYIAYADQSAGDKLTVKKLEGGNWQPVGTEGWSTGAITGSALAVDGGVPYVAYLESGLPVIQVYDEETGWAPVGAPALLEGARAGSLAMKLHQGSLYVAYIDTEGRKVRLVKWEEAAGWHVLDTSAFPAAVSGGSVSLSLEAGLPYVAYPSSAGIEVWRGTGAEAWERLPAADDRYTYALSVYVDSGSPYLVYSTGPDSYYTLIVKKYINGAWYPVGDPIRPESGRAGSYAIRVHEGNPLLVYYNGHQEVETKQYAYTWCEATLQYADERADTARAFPCGEPLPRPADPVRTHYLFSEWLLEGGAPYDFRQPLAADTTLRASWKLPAPGNMRIVGSEDGYVELEWGSVDAASRYALYVGTEAGSYDTEPIIVTDTAGRVEGLTNGVAYYFAVKAVNDEAESDYATEVSETPVTKPDAPAIVKVEPGNGEATVTFDAPEDDGGSPIDHYELTVYPGETTVTGSGSPITVTDLDNIREYRFAVVAVNAAGKKSEPSALSAPAMPFASCSVSFHFKDDRLPVEEAVKCGFAAEQPDIQARSGYTLAGWTNAANGASFDLSATPIEEDMVLEAKWQIDRAQLAMNQWHVLGVGQSPATNSAIDAGSGALYAAEVHGGRISVRQYIEGDGWSDVGPRGFAETGGLPVQLQVDGGTPYVLFGDLGFPGILTLMKYDAADEAWTAVGGQEVMSGTLLSFDLHVEDGTPYVYAWYFDFAAGFTSKVLKYVGDETGAWQEAAGLLADSASVASIMRMDGDRIYGALIEADHSIRVKRWDEAGEWVDVGGPGAALGTVGGSLSFDLVVEGGRPYLAYISNDHAIQALSFAEGSWHALAPVEVDGTPEQLAVEVYNGGPYLLYAYEQPDHTKKTAVARLDDGGWEVVGDEWTTAGGRADEPQLRVVRGTAYAAYSNGNSEQVIREFKLPLCRVTFDSSGGTAVPDRTVPCGERAGLPVPAPQKANYTFAGWYTSPELARAWEFDRDVVTADTVLVAKWNWNYADDILPIGLAASAGDEQVTLTWNGAPDTVAYSVYVKTAHGSYGDAPAITVTGATYEATVQGLHNGTAYTFQVSLMNRDGNTANSEEVVATPLGPTPP
ncbi:fibronectin type III domain-containing protein, partial [Paenibacillus sp. IB182496]